MMNSNISAVQKPKFPSILKRLMTSLTINLSANMKSGFRTCEIYPLDRDAVKSKLQFNKMPITPNNTEIVKFSREQRGFSSP